jgi:hypothetical protein
MPRYISLLEIVSVYSFVQAYIWRWQYTHPHLVWFILLLLVASHLCHRDTPRSLGFRFANFFSTLWQALPWAAPFLVTLLLAGIWTGRLWSIQLGADAAGSSLRYALWGLFQQYGLQGFFHNRLMSVIPDRLRSSVCNGFIFMSLHLPNPVLMFFTLFGGMALSWIYAQSRNLFALGVCHGAIGLLLSNTLPRTWLHNMRVGPGYFR